MTWLMNQFFHLILLEYTNIKHYPMNYHFEYDYSMLINYISSTKTDQQADYISMIDSDDGRTNRPKMKSFLK